MPPTHSGGGWTFKITNCDLELWPGIQREAFALRISPNAARSGQGTAQKYAELERKLATHDQAITEMLKAIHELMNQLVPQRRGIRFTADF